jgi:hypothetical protein
VSLSYIPPENLQGSALIVQYVIDCRAKGHFLPYDEHRIISKWLISAQDADILLLILADLLPNFYAKGQNRTHPPSLSRLDKKITQILNTRKHREQFAVET